MVKSERFTRFLFERNGSFHLMNVTQLWHLNKLSLFLVSFFVFGSVKDD